jgi:hypothetical protein
MATAEVFLYYLKMRRIKDQDGVEWDAKITGTSHGPPPVAKYFVRFFSVEDSSRVRVGELTGQMLDFEQASEEALGESLKDAKPE